MEILLSHHKHMVVVGETGTGKSVNIASKLNGGMGSQYEPAFTTFSAQTSANGTQDILDGKFEKRRQGKEPRAPSMFQTLLEHHARFLTAGVASALLSIVRHARSIALPLVGQEIGLSTTQIGACLSAALQVVEAGSKEKKLLPAGYDL